MSTIEIIHKKASSPGWHAKNAIIFHTVIQYPTLITEHKHYCAIVFCDDHTSRTHIGFRGRVR